MEAITEEEASKHAAWVSDPYFFKRRSYHSKKFFGNMKSFGEHFLMTSSTMLPPERVLGAKIHIIQVT